MVYINMVSIVTQNHVSLESRVKDSNTFFCFENIYKFNEKVKCYYNILIVASFIYRLPNKELNRKVIHYSLKYFPNIKTVF